MQCNQTYVYVPDEAPLQVNEPIENIYYNHVVTQNYSILSDCRVSWNTLLEEETVEYFQQETKQTINNLYSKGHHSPGMSSTTRRERTESRKTAEKADVYEVGV